MPDLSSVAILMYFSYIPVAWFQLRLALAAYPVSNWLSSYEFINFDQTTRKAINPTAFSKALSDEEIEKLKAQQH